MKTNLIVRRGAKKVINLIAAGKHFEAFRVLRHEYSNYDAEWKKAGADYSVVAAALRVEVVAKYPELAGVVAGWKA